MKQLLEIPAHCVDDKFGGFKCTEWWTGLPSPGSSWCYNTITPQRILESLNRYLFFSLRGSAPSAVALEWVCGICHCLHNDQWRRFHLLERSSRLPLVPKSPDLSKRTALWSFGSCAACWHDRVILLHSAQLPSKRLLCVGMWYLFWQGCPRCGFNSTS